MAFCHCAAFDKHTLKEAQSGARATLRPGAFAITVTAACLDPFDAELQSDADGRRNARKRRVDGGRVVGRTLVFSSLPEAEAPARLESTTRRRPSRAEAAGDWTTHCKKRGLLLLLALPTICFWRGVSGDARDIVHHVADDVEGDAHVGY